MAFSYKSLDRSRNEIRVVHILPAADPASAVKCSIFHVSLDEQPLYEALSYTWGLNVFPESITLDGVRFSVTENLKNAMLRFRDQTEVKVLWVDAICINQEDIIERNFEVLRMLKIYQTAQRVCVWLGDAKSNSDLAMDHLEQLAFEWDSFRDAELQIWSRHIAWVALSTFQLAWNLICSFLKACLKREFRIGIVCLLYTAQNGGGSIVELVVRSLFSYQCAISTLIGVRTWWKEEPWLRYEQPRATTDPATFHALEELFKRPWWVRTWIVQEVAAASNVVFFCGQRSITLAQISDAVYHLQYRVATHDDPARDLYLETPWQRFALFLCIPKPETGIHISLLYLMVLFSHAKATDPKDKIYGFLGLAQASNVREQTYGLFGLAKDNTEVVPDYSKTAAQVYRELVQVAIQKSGNLDILCACGRAGTVENLPSWVPDWTATTAATGYIMEFLREPYTLAAPRVHSKQGVPAGVAVFSEDGQRMILHGIIIGSLTGEPIVCHLDDQRNPLEDETISQQLVLVCIAWHILQAVFRLLTYIPGVPRIFRFLAKKNLGVLSYVLRYRLTQALYHRDYAMKSHPKQFHFSNLGARTLALRDRDRRRESKIWTVKTAHNREFLWLGLNAVSSDLERADTGCEVVFFIGAKVPFLIKRISKNEDERLYSLLGPVTFFETTMDTMVWEEVKKCTSKGDFKLDQIELV